MPNVYFTPEQLPHKLHKLAHDLSGQDFGLLTALEPVGHYVAPKNPQNTTLLWRCQCACGEVADITSVNLRSGTQSCGCLKWICRQTHGMTKTRIYTIWQQMHNRCRNPSYTQYANYGGRGIKVCEAWASFDRFFGDMGQPPSDEHTLDRIEVNGNYEFSNCRWATSQQQRRNKTTNRMLTVNGESKLIIEWVETYGVPFTTITGRLDRGWTPFDAVSIPPQRFNYKKRRHCLLSPKTIPKT